MTSEVRTSFTELAFALQRHRDVALVSPLPPEGRAGAASTADRLPPPVVVGMMEAGELEAVGGTSGRRQLPDRVQAAARKALAQGASRVMEAAGRQWLIEVFLAPPRLVIFGAGHIGQALARLGHALEYRILLYDDRPQYARPELAPPGAEVICRSFTEVMDHISLGRHDHVVIVTRGHQHDAQVLEDILDSPAAYLGMIGSNRRVGAVRQSMEAKGFTHEQLNRIFAPIGLDIGAETPQEIALAILAEITLVRRGGSGLPLRQARQRGVPALVDQIHETAPVPDLDARRAGRSRRPTGSQEGDRSFAAVSDESDGSELMNSLQAALERGEAAAVCTVIGTRGSTPRRAGAKMVVLRDGRCFGTIGGGCGEAEVRQSALTAMDTQAWRRHWLDLTEDFDREEREVCGGFMDVLVTPVMPAAAVSQPAQGPAGPETPGD